MIGFIGAASAQKGSVRGFVYEKETGEAVLFSNVYLEGTTYGAATDVDGFYSINGVPVGEYVLMTTSIGYDTTRVEIQIQANKIVNQKLFINKSDVRLETFEVGGERDEAKSEVRIGTVKITPKQINKIPAVGGEPDLAQYLQILPGVVFTGDQGGQLYIRGGSQIQTKVLLDGLTIYNPFHSVGLFSVFETDLIRNVEVLTGGFNAEYGGRISAVIDIATRDGNKNRLSGKFATNTFLSKAILEGPIIKLKDGEEWSGSYVLAGKISYLDESSKLFYSYIDTAGLPYNFLDLYAKASFTAGTGSKLSVSAYRHNDNADFQGRSLFAWDTWGMGANFSLVPAFSKAIIDGFFSYSTYEMKLTEANEKPRTSSIGGFNGGVSFSYFFPQGDIRYGIEVSGFATTFDFFNVLGSKIEANQYTTELGGFVKYKADLGGRLILEPSIRLNVYASLPAVTFEPRFGFKYNLTDKVRVKGSGGFYTQNFISTKSDRDVVNLFTGFLSAPEESLRNADGEAVNNNLQNSVHAIGGVEVDVSRELTLNAEVYYKGFPQLINLNREKLFPADPNYVVENGRAYGFDVLAKYDYRNLFLWGVYSLGFVRRTDANQTYPPHFDRRHNLNFLASYGFGNNWEVSFRWNYGSAFPFTRTQGFYEDINFLDGVATDLNSQNGNLGILYEEALNQGRLSDYHRLDVSLKKGWELGKHAKIEASASVTNIYNRENVFYVDRIRGQRVDQLPLLPSGGLTFSF